MTDSSFRVTEGVHDLFTDFASDHELPPNSLYTMLADEQKKLSDGRGLAELLDIHAATELRFGVRNDGARSKTLWGKLSEDSLNIYQSESGRLEIPMANVARIAVLHGFVLEMDVEQFSF